MSEKVKKKHYWQFYKGLPLKRKLRVDGGLLLTFMHKEAGVRGPQLLIQQRDWEQHGELREVPSHNAEYIRSLVPAG
jgi:hypothetical protein